jgi:DNA end-binding protein Ku
MARSLWSGSLSFGLVNIPVALVTAVRDLDVHFHQLHESDQARIELRRYCSEEDKEVDWEEVAHAYERDGGKKDVILTDEELAAVEPRRTRTIEIEEFVDLGQIDPLHFDRPYYLVPRGESEGVRRAYRLLVDVMRKTDRAALGRVVIRAKEYLVAMRVRDGVLMLSTMLFPDEIRPTNDVDTGSARKPPKQQVERAVVVVQELSTEWKPSRYKDRYRKRLQKLIASKEKGGTITVPDVVEEPTPAPDLMEALEATLKEIKGRKGKRKAGRSRAKART